MLSSLITIVYAIIIIVLVPVFLSLEIASRKSRVYAAPSTPWMRRLVIARLKEEAAALDKKNPVIYELGAAWGTLALAAARACPDARIIGYDLAGVPLMVARWRARLRGIKNVTFIKADFFKQDLSDADIALTYLTENLMSELGEKAMREMKSGTILICNTFGIRGWTPVRVDRGQKRILKLDVLTYRLPESLPRG